MVPIMRFGVALIIVLFNDCARMTQRNVGRDGVKKYGNCNLCDSSILLTPEQHASGMKVRVCLSRLQLAYEGSSIRFVWASLH